MKLASVRRRTNVRALRAAFTLFELILAIALSVTLIALIGTAINLYLARVDASRTQVEEAQLARSILTMIADDIRSTTIYQPQDTSALATMAAGAYDPEPAGGSQRGGGGGGSGGSGGRGGDGSSSAGGFDVDDIDSETQVTSAEAGPSTSGGSGLGGSASGTSGSSGMSGMQAENAEPETTLPLGLNGSLDELYVDATRLPRREELFATITGYTNAPIGVQAGTGVGASASTAATSGIPRPSDLKSVRYFVRVGEPVEAGSIAATSLSPAAQLRAGGLVRQEIPRTMRVWAEQSGNTMVLDSGQALIAPEVVHIQFRYFDGTQVTDVWDMRERNTLPMAIEVTLWLAPARSDATAMAGGYDIAGLANARQYRQTVFLPMSQAANSAAMGGMGGMTSGSGSGTSGMSGSGAGFGAGTSNTSTSGSGF